MSFQYLARRFTAGLLNQLSSSGKFISHCANIFYDWYVSVHAVLAKGTAAGSNDGTG